MMDNNREALNVVIIGHVDHGKSTVIGRLLADTGSLPEGKLEQVKENCRKNAKPFEYAFLLDALKDEQAQGITIDAARCFFSTKKRDYMVLDAPGHIEFLKNMVTGAARAEAALLVIDAKEGVQENSKRHGYLASMLGIKQIVVLINKMDLADYDEGVYDAIVKEYTEFLAALNVVPVEFIPVSAREGVNIAVKSGETAWYKGPDVLEQIDRFTRGKGLETRPFRFPVQDIYKFTNENDDRRIIAGTVLTGQVKVGDAVTFYPSLKKTVVSSVEGFNSSAASLAQAEEATGLTMAQQIYIQRGELMAKDGEVEPLVGSRLRVNMFWMGRKPMVLGKNYKVKLGAQRVSGQLVEVLNVLDASSLTSVTTKQQVDRHDVAEVVIETARPVAFDLATSLEHTSRMVFVDDYEISGGGIALECLDGQDGLLEQHVQEREFRWVDGIVSRESRSAAYGHQAHFVLLFGDVDVRKQHMAKQLEALLVSEGIKSYYLGISNLISGLGSDVDKQGFYSQDEHIRRLGELARIFLESGQVFIASISNLDDYDIEHLKKLIGDDGVVTLISVGPGRTFQSKLDLQVEAGRAIEEVATEVKGILAAKGVL